MPKELNIDLKDTEGRIIAYENNSMIVINTYIPNAGQNLKRIDYRINTWNANFDKYLIKLHSLHPKKNIIWCGDLNVAHGDIDIHNPLNNIDKSPGFSIKERMSFHNIINNLKWKDSFRYIYGNCVSKVKQ